MNDGYIPGTGLSTLGSPVLLSTSARTTLRIPNAIRQMYHEHGTNAEVLTTRKGMHSIDLSVSSPYTLRPVESNKG